MRGGERSDLECEVGLTPLTWISGIFNMHRFPESEMAREGLE